MRIGSHTREENTEEWSAMQERANASTYELRPPKPSSVYDAMAFDALHRRVNKGNKLNRPNLLDDSQGLIALFRNIQIR